MFFNLQSSSYLPYKLSIYAGHLCRFGLINNKLYNCTNYYSHPLCLDPKAITKILMSKIHQCRHKTLEQAMLQIKLV